ncbi:MAG: site-specific DNA-methyltransferase [Kiritimatiellae bacterium]|nr:site-specific DNA-methyltransferase [Kiritimatiellia bacterium]
MKTLPDGSVDMICADLPYGTTACPWDRRFPMEPLWEQFWRVAKRNAAICLFAQQPFATDLINAARKWFRYEWVWVKTRAGGPLNAKKMPLRGHELVLVFYRALPTYHPQMRKAKALRGNLYYRPRQPGSGDSEVYGCRASVRDWRETGMRYPVDVVTIKSKAQQCRHAPTEKPVELLEMLVRTYTDPGELVLDPTMGSGSCGVACANAGRRFVGMEKDAHFFELAAKRLEAASPKEER